MRRYSALSTNALIARLVVIAATAAVFLTTGCATSEEIQLRMRVQELEQIVAGKDDDLGYLMRENIEQQAYIYALESGAVWQARQMARIRETCEL